jgi:hypothetical protein
MRFMSTPPLNTLTAWPMLRLMLSLEGMEPPQLPASRSWAVFKSFLALPTGSERDVASFQTTWIREDPDTPIFVVRYLRELTDDATGFGRITRSVELQFLYDLSAPPTLRTLELWSEDFESVRAFTAAVEALPEWKFSVEHAPSDGELLQDEESADSVA